MKAVNLHFLTRIQDPGLMSLTYQSLAGLGNVKSISPHEAASLCAFTDLLSEALHRTKMSRLEDPSPQACSVSEDAPFEDISWLNLLDGFFFSYVIEHIGKEFDLLKISSDGECALNIELKSEDIGEERIRKQLEQNRYYLSHAARTIFSFTYVMDIQVLYCMNERGYLRPCSAEELVSVLRRPSLQACLTEGIDRFFRSRDYLISPVAAPEKFLQGQYFLTNQQFDFRRRILQHLKEEPQPVVSVTGIAGTGKTLLLFDLAMQLSRKNRVLLLHSGPLRRGHEIIDARLKNVDILSADRTDSDLSLPGYRFLIVDEADHLASSTLEALLRQAKDEKIPVILAYDPHSLLSDLQPFLENVPDISDKIRQSCTLTLAFTGNIRINRPVYSFLRTVLNLKDHPGRPDFSCIELLYANDHAELQLMTEYYKHLKYELIRSSAGLPEQDLLIAQEYEKVLIVMDDRYYYNDSFRLCVREDDESPIRILYEALSRTRESLCLIVTENEPLFSILLAIKLHQL